MIDRVKFAGATKFRARFKYFYMSESKLVSARNGKEAVVIVVHFGPFIIGATGVDVDD